MVPTARDLRFAWEEMPQKVLDEQKQKMRESLHAALIDWAQKTGEATDYTDNLPAVPAPVGHWYEMPNLLRNGVLARTARAAAAAPLPDAAQHRHRRRRPRPGDARPAHARAACLSFEVIPRRSKTAAAASPASTAARGLVEGLAMPREEDEFSLTYYNSMTTWIDIAKLLEVFGLKRDEIVRRRKSRRRHPQLGRADADLHHAQGREEALGPRPGGRLPGGQFEKLWGDMTAFPK